MDQLVSIIVPIYGVEAYLNRAIDSILAQTYSHLEIILVDDGGVDRCGAICDEYQKKDNRIKVIHKENGGLSDARNAGLDIATGEYIAFVDSDDYIAKDYVETLLKALVEHDADVSLCSYKVTESLKYDESVFDCNSDHHIEDGEIEVCNHESLLTNLYDLNHRDATYFIVAWNKLYKASLWENVRFPKGKIHEDEATTYKIYDLANKGVYLHKPLYAYFSAPESITRATFQKKRLDWMDALDARIQYFESKCTIDDDSQREFYEKQIGYAKKALADGSIHYYYPLVENLPDEQEEKKRLKAYVKNQWKKEKEEKQGLPVVGPLGYGLFLFSPTLYRLVTNVDRDKKERFYQIAFCIIFAWLAFLCFYKLGVKYVDPWDESQHGVNAYEMLKQHTLIRSTYLYETDYYNLKPPMSMWTIMLSMVLFGKSIVAMRIPPALCYLLLAFLSARFARKRYGRMASLFVLGLLTANTAPFIAHMVRAGDADSLYVLLFSLAMFSMISIKERKRNIYLCALYFALAFLTKSFHSLMIVAIGGLYLIFSGEITKLKIKEWVKFIASAIVPIGIWAFFRFLSDGTTFFRLMWETDVRGRTSEGFGSNTAGFGYYFSFFLGKMSGQIQVYLVALILLLLIFGMGLFFDQKIKEKRNDIIGFLLWILIPTFAFSIVSTKLLWYLYPVITALLIALGCVAGNFVEKKKVPKYLTYGVCGSIFVVVLIYSGMTFKLVHSYGINGVQTNDFQILIQKTGNRDEYDGAIAYRALSTGEGAGSEGIETEWAKQDIFVAEVYGDYLCEQKGYGELQKASMDLVNGMSTKVILFTEKNLYDNLYKTEAESLGFHTDVIDEQGEYVSVLIQ